MIVRPTETIRQQRGLGGYSAPLGFVFVNVLVLCGISALLAVFTSSATYYSTRRYRVRGRGMLICGAVVRMLAVAPLVALATGIYHLSALAFGGRGGLPATFRAIALSSVAWVLLGAVALIWSAIFPHIPLITWLVGIAGLGWSTWLVAIGFRELHEMPSGRAIPAAIVPALVYVAMVIALIAGVSARMASGASA
jgi:hypothetical protein